MVGDVTARASSLAGTAEPTGSTPSFATEFAGVDFRRVALELSGNAAFNGIADATLPRAAEIESLPGAAGAFSTGDVTATLERVRAHPPGQYRLSVDEFMALLSTVAADYLEELAVLARGITRMRFGRKMQLYAPLYLSNECASICTYCAFRRDNEIRRTTLSLAEIVTEARVLHAQGIRHILLLTGEEYRATPLDFIADAATRLREMFPSIAIEVYPLKSADYARLREAGVDGLTVYQETYDRERYHQVHLGGMKKNWGFRLVCPDRAGQAGLRRVAIGALLGLSDPAAEVFSVGLHARHLLKHYWRTEVSIGLPRLRPAAGFDAVPALSDRRFVQYLCALRLFLPDVGLVLSTRESPALRDRLADLMITTMSAGSKTDPGGYSLARAEEQFSIEDHRSVAEVARALDERGLEPVFTDWSNELK